MEVTVRLFAMLRERAGASEVALELPEGARVRDALASLSGLADGLPLVLAVNREYAPEEQPLRAGDELALIPPVSGGAALDDSLRCAAAAGGAPEPAAAPDGARPHVAPGGRDPWVRVTAEPLALDPLAARVRDPRAGAVVTFAGVTREVERLEYEAYVEMAVERIALIAREASARHGLCAAAVEHRIGSVPLSEPSVVVAASAPHRGAAFAGARELIDRVKREAPIWKREVEAGARRWVAGAEPRRG